MSFANGAHVVWTSNRGTRRKARVLTGMKCSPHHIIEVTRGHWGEAGKKFVVPSRRLEIDTEPTR